MVFIELSPVAAFREENWSDEDLRRLQSYLLHQPDAGEVIRGGRKLALVRVGPRQERRGEGD